MTPATSHVLDKQVPTPESEPVAGNYFVAVYPPFSAWKPELNPLFHEVLAQPPVPRKLGIYLHIPFCQKKCDYCYYLSYVGQPSGVVDGYLQSVRNELKAYAELPAIHGRDVAFLYFGGGTPSVLTSAQLQTLMTEVRGALPLGFLEEFTYECAPRSARDEFLGTMRQVGVTRLSMGVQSLDDDVLKANGRVHLADDVMRAFARVREAGFTHVNLDLMAGLVGESWESWEDTVCKTIGLGPESVTIYQTEIPHNTRLYQDYLARQIREPLLGWEQKRDRVNWAFQKLSDSGYTVVSAYAAVKDPVRHDSRYQRHLWGGQDMLGLGVAAFGYLQGVHYQNLATLESYQSAVQARNLPVLRSYRLDAEEQFVREFILQLKYGKVSRRALREEYGQDLLEVFVTPLRNLEAEGWLECDEQGVWLTQDGLLRVDRLIPTFFPSRHSGVRYT